MGKTLFLRTLSQVVLFKHELAGQLSDGHWENSVPFSHWKDWCKAEVVIANPQAGESIGRNFYPLRDKYNLLHKDLLSVVGGRMLMQVRLAQGMGLESLNELESRIECPEDFAVAPLEVPSETLYTGEYWDRERTKCAKYDLGVVNSHLMHGNYSKKDLIADLKEINTAMKTLSSSPDRRVVPTQPGPYSSMSR